MHYLIIIHTYSIYIILVLESGNKSFVNCDFDCLDYTMNNALDKPFEKDRSQMYYTLKCTYTVYCCMVTMSKLVACLADNCSGMTEHVVH